MIMLYVRCERGIYRYKIKNLIFINILYRIERTKIICSYNIVRFNEFVFQYRHWIHRNFAFGSISHKQSTCAWTELKIPYN